MHVDDETGFLEATKQILEMQALVHVYAAASVEEAKKILQTKKVDVIVSDYQMPAENGLEFLRELRETEIHIPFILFTGRGREEVAIEALNIGAAGYFNKFGKPATVYGQLIHAIFSCVKAKRAEDDLLKFKTVSDRANYGVMLIDVDGKMLYVNNAFAKMHGYAIKELVGKDYSIIHTKDEYLRVDRSRKKLFGKGYLVMEEKHLKKDGSLIPVQSNVTLIRDQKGSPSFIAVIVTDITERKKAEKALKESEERFRSTLDSMMEGCQIIDHNWRYIYLNKAAVKHGRTTKKNLLGKTMMEAYPGIENTELFSVLKKCMTERKSAHMENVFSYPNGEKRFFELRIQPVPEGLFILSIDSTKRKKAEEKIQSLAKFPSENPNPVLRITKDGRVLFSNKAAKVIINESKRGKKLETVKLLKQAAFECLSSGVTKEVEIGHKGKIFSFVFAPVIDEDYCNSYGRDITTRKKVEKALNGSVSELSLVNEKLGVVGTLTRHDVRNKLSVVAGNLFIAKELLPPDHEAVKYLERTEPAFAQIKQIFDRAKAYERLGVDKLSYVDVGKSCEEAISLIHDLGNIKIEKDCKGLTLYADALLSQLFYNLIDNSIKHGETVSTIRMYYKEGRDGLKLIYEDDGTGIAISEKEKIFSETQRSTGIGLRMIKIMCKIYGWTIQETGKKGKGAQFTITIPKKTKDGKTAYILSMKTK